MRLTPLLPFAAVVAAVVIPDDAITEQILASKTEPFYDDVPSKKGHFRVNEAFDDASSSVQNTMDAAFLASSDTDEEGVEFTSVSHSSLMAFDVDAWLDSATSFLDGIDLLGSADKPGRPRRPPWHKPRHGKSDLTIYELVNSCDHTSEFAKIINEFDDIVSLLNSTTANHTILAPTNAAFKKLPKDGKKPPKDVIKKSLSYYLSAGLHPTSLFLTSHTIPSLLDEESLGNNPQRLRVGLSLRGLTVNFYSRIIAPNIFGTNGVIHGVNSLLFRPPPARKIIELLPGQFSTFTLAIKNTGVLEAYPDAFKNGGTYFAPSNLAFKKLGPKINAFLFSKRGEKYLKALLKYHFVAGRILYSDAYYGPESLEDAADNMDDTSTIPKGHFRIDLPTLLDDKSLRIDIARFGGFTRMKVNGRTFVVIQDGIAKDGVIHVVNNVLIPPKSPGGSMHRGEDLTVAELVERLDVYVDLGL